MPAESLRSCARWATCSTSTRSVSAADASAKSSPRPEVIRSRSAPLTAEGGIAVLRGNLAPNGAVIKPSAATPALMRHRGRAVVFSSIEDFKARIDDPALEVDADSILVLQNCGQRGYPGIPEVGNMALPRKLLEQGVRDMVRISDVRMSGTAFGTVILHASPEAAVGGPIALVRSGDWITLESARADSNCWSVPTNSPRGAPTGGRRSRRRRRVISASTSITCCRPTKARISIFWSVAAATTCRAKVTEDRRRAGAQASSRRRTTDAGSCRGRRWSRSGG